MLTSVFLAIFLFFSPVESIIDGPDTTVRSMSGKLQNEGVRVYRRLEDE